MTDHTRPDVRDVPAVPDVPAEHTAGRADAGRALRETVRRSDHASWAPAPDRPDPVDLLSAQDATRLPWLVPVRHTRMAESPFAFYRGAAAVMAADLARTPATGLTTQLCGDAHLANFGTYASPERRQVFDLNDFDETLPGPWEWDVKRLAASAVLAAHDNGWDDDVARAAAVRSVTAYREAMNRYATWTTMDVWYAHVSLEDIQQALPSKADRERFERGAAKARRRTSQRALGRLTETVDGKLRIRNDPPLVERLEDLAGQLDSPHAAADIEEGLRANLKTYAASLPDDRLHLLQRFRLIDIALKVVGVGSVGTRCFIGLFQGLEHGEPLVLQAKEATTSVLEAHLPPSRYPHPGQRVVEGQRLMQAASDIFLGWSEHRVTYYWRQLHDMKGSADVAAMRPDQLSAYLALCGTTLAHAHARAGDAVAISAYLGAKDTFDRAVGEFAMAYAAQATLDHAAFTAAIDDGRIEGATEATPPTG